MGGHLHAESHLILTALESRCPYPHFTNEDWDTAVLTLIQKHKWQSQDSNLSVVDAVGALPLSS